MLEEVAILANFPISFCGFNGELMNRSVAESGRIIMQEISSFCC